jgi:hypothetical protein
MIDIEDIEARINNLKRPRVTKESIEAKIATVSYSTVILDDVKVGMQCIIVLKNGWMSTGFSAPADSANFDEEIGRHYSFEDAFKPLWKLEGYLLRERLHLADAALAGDGS